MRILHQNEKSLLVIFIVTLSDQDTKGKLLIYLVTYLHIFTHFTVTFFVLRIKRWLLSRIVLMGF